MAVDNLDYEIGVLDIFCGIEVDDLTLVLGIENLLLHHALAHGCHLRAALGVDDGSHDVAAECRAYLQQQVLVLLACLGVSVVTDLKGGTVGGEAAVETRADTGTKVTTYAGGAHEASLWLDLAEQVDEHSGVGIGGVGRETLVLDLVETVDTVGEHLGVDIVELVAYGNSFELDVETVGEHTAFCKELKAHVGHTAIFVFEIYDNVVLVHG